MRTSGDWNRDNSVIKGVAIGTPTSGNRKKLPVKIILPASPVKVWKSNRQTVYKFSSPIVKKMVEAQT